MILTFKDDNLSPIKLGQVNLFNYTAPKSHISLKMLHHLYNMWQPQTLSLDKEKTN